MAVVVSFLGKWDGKDIDRAMKQMQGLKANTEGTGKSVGSSFAGMAKSAIGLGAALGIGFAGIQGLASALRDSIAEAQEAIKVNAATAQIIKATGGAANVTADQVADLSQRLSEQIAVDDELIQSSANLILTFKNVANQGTGLAAIFDRTVLAAQDLAAAGFGDAESAAKMLGKALNDPEKGLTALSRAGVTFTQQQKEQIKTLTEGGDVLSAQQLILAEVESQVGGVAAATMTGVDQFNVYFANLKEEIGLALLPFINALISGVIPAIRTVGDLVRNSSKFFEENKNVIILTTVAVGALTVALTAQRLASAGVTLSFIAQTVAVNAYAAATVIAAGASSALSIAMRAIPFVAIATAVAGFVMVLDQGAKSQEKWRREQENTLRATNGLKDATGNYTKEAVALGTASRFAHLNGEAMRGTISGTVGAAVAAGNAIGGTLTPAVYGSGDAAESAATSYVSLFEAIWNAKRIASDFANTSGTVTSAISEGVKLGGSPVWQEMADGYGKVDKAARDAAGGASAADKELDKLSDKKQQRLNALKELAETAKQSMADMRASVYSTVSGWLDLGNAADAYKARQTLVAETLKALEDQRRTMTDESTQDQKDKLQELADAHERAKAAAASGAQSIVAEFNDQAKKFGEFGAKLQELLRAGLNKTSFMQILSMGAERGGEVADSYLKGNTSELVAQTNSTMAEYDKLSQSIAEESSRAFYQAGLQSALALLKAFTAALGKGGSARREMKAIIKDLESELQVNINTNVATPAGTSSFAPAAASSSGGAFDYIGPISGIPDIPAGGFDLSGIGGIGAGLGFGAFANGGLVNGPMLGLVGEAGPELIVPLDKVGSMGGTSIALTVNAGMGTNGAEVGRQIVDALKAYERRNGAVYASA